MKSRRNADKLTLRAWFPGAVVLLWVLPVIAVIIIFGILLRTSIVRSARNEIDLRAAEAVSQTSMRISYLLDESKSVSYDNEISSAYRRYLEDSDKAALYKTASEYLNSRFSRDEKVKAVFLSFRDVQGVRPYIVNREGISYKVLKEYRQFIEENLGDITGETDSGIVFHEVDGSLYLIRNLLDGKFQVYASVALLVDEQNLFPALMSVENDRDAIFSLDSVLYSYLNGSLIKLGDDYQLPQIYEPYSEDTDGHTLTYYADMSLSEKISVMPEIRMAIIAIVVLTVILIGVMLHLLYNHVLNPVETLSSAMGKVRSGERGYEIESDAPNREFEELFEHFNGMSGELKEQFDRLFEEQQELQRAKIKALQSQINPHFLNNTLEVINWEARLSENAKVSQMIEALSTMLGATLNRDGRGMIPLSEEMQYVDAYLYIINERLGGRLEVEKDIPAELLSVPIPRLILQPLVENAIEHDITASNGGRLTISAGKKDGNMHLSVEHDGTLTHEDEENIGKLLSVSSELDESGLHSVQIGIRNVNHRLKLLFGDGAGLTITQKKQGTVLAEIVFPLQ